MGDGLVALDIDTLNPVIGDAVEAALGRVR